MPKRSSLSVVVVTENEEENVGDCLDSVAWADEIIVVDNYSSDETINIAKKYTNKVFRHKLETLGRQKQWGVQQATEDWILLIDADERINEELRAEIQKVLENPKSDAYNVYFQQFFLGQPLPPTLSGGHPRLFKRGKGHITPDPVGERIIIDGRIGQLKNFILHYSYKDIFQVIEKFNKYTQSEARVMYDAGSRASFTKIFLSLIYNFWVRQKVYADYKAGWRGFVLTALFLIYHFLKWAKIWELQFREGEKTKND